MSRDEPIADGVWAGTINIGDRDRVAAISIGTRPTYHGDDGVRLPEAHVLDYSGDLYDRQMECRLYRMLRPQRWFGGSAELIAPVHRDIEDTRRWASSSGRRIDRLTDPVQDREWRRSRRIAAAAIQAHEAGTLTHSSVATLAGVPTEFVQWLHPEFADLTALVVDSTLQDA